MVSMSRIQTLLQKVDILIVPLLLTIWVALVYQKAYQPSVMVGVLICEMLVVGGLILSTAKRQEWRAVCNLYVVALIWFTIAIFVVRTLPQAALAPSDNHERLASAIVEHWKGETVRRDEFPLPWLIKWNRDWTPDDNVPLGYVLGTWNYFYSIYLATIFYFGGYHDNNVYLSQAVVLAGMPPIVYQLSNLLFNRRSVSLVAVVLAFLDTNFPVMGAVLFKEALLCFLAPFIAYLALLSVKSDSPMHVRALLALVSTTMSILRYQVTVTLWFAMVVVSSWPAVYRSVKPKSVWANLVAWYIVSSILLVPPWTWGDHNGFSIGLKEVITTNFLPLEGGLVQMVLSSNVKDEGLSASIKEIPRYKGTYADPSTSEWLQLLKERPLFALVRSIVRTVFAPYPWVAIRDGMPGKSFYELFYPGVPLWCLGLPFLLYGVWRLRQGRATSEVLILTIWVSTSIVGYLVYYGEFSSRQRVHLMPVLWIFIAFGIVEFFRDVRTRRLNRQGSSLSAATIDDRYAKWL